MTFGVQHFLLALAKSPNPTFPRPCRPVIETLEHVVTLNIHRDIITAVAFSCDGRLLYSCAQDSSIRVHSLEDQQQIHANNVGDLGLSSIIVLPDNDVRGKLSG